MWINKLQNEYSNLEEFKQYSDIYSLAERLGYKNAEEAWNNNPIIQGSVNPSDFKVLHRNTYVVVNSEFDIIIVGSKQDCKDYVNRHNRKVIANGGENEFNAIPVFEYC